MSGDHPPSDASASSASQSVLIAGSRSFGHGTDVAFPVRYLDAVIAASGFSVDEVVSGTARGADTAGERWAARNGIPVRQFPGFWDGCAQATGWARSDGGPLRNRAMVRYADAAIALWDGSSPGTADCITACRNYGLPLYVDIFTDDETPAGYLDGVSRDAAQVVAYARNHGLSRSDLDALAEQHGVTLSEAALVLYSE